MVKAEIIKLEEGYAKLSQMMYYDSSVVSIKPGSQMEAKWKEEVARHAAGGNTYSFVEARDFSIAIEGNGGNVVYTSVIKNRIYGTYFQSTMHQSFEVIDGKILFYSEYETDSIQVYYINIKERQLNKEKNKMGPQIAVPLRSDDYNHSFPVS